MHSIIIIIIHTILHITYILYIFRLISITAKIFKITWQMCLYTRSCLNKTKIKTIRTDAKLNLKYIPDSLKNDYNAVASINSIILFD